MMQDSVTGDERLTEAKKHRLGVYAGAGFFFSPGAWLLQVIVSETLSAQTCDAATPLKAPGVSHIHAWLYSTSVVALVISVVCATLSLYGYLFLDKLHKRIKKRSRDRQSQEQPSREEEEISRKRFIALCSALIGCGFLIGILFTILAEVFLVSCSQWH